MIVAPVVDDQLEFLETIVLNQQSQLQLLTDRNLELTDRILSLEASIVSNGEGDEDDDELDTLTDRIVSLEASVVSLEASVDSLEEEIEESDTDEIDVGSTYIRWGRTTCPSTAQRVYEGKCRLITFVFFMLCNLLKLVPEKELNLNRNDKNIIDFRYLSICWSFLYLLLLNFARLGLLNGMS